jgi:xanthine dehydrogenase YagR molybdenum-binding subunit
MSTHSVLRYEAALKVTGSAVYEAEVPAAGLLHAALVQAPISCGDVLSVDATPAIDLPGFAAMVSHADTEELQASPATALIRERTVHFAGQPVALVAASSLQEAKEAARAIQVKLEVRPAVSALAQALDKSFAPAMVGRFPAETHRGDASRALAEADLVVRHRYDTAVNNHHPMEPHAVVCCWEGGKAVVHTSTQAIFGTRAMISHAFQMPVSDIRVISRFLGGGFGCKGSSGGRGCSGRCLPPGKPAIRCGWN